MVECATQGGANMRVPTYRPKTEMSDRQLLRTAKEVLNAEGIYCNGLHVNNNTAFMSAPFQGPVPVCGYNPVTRTIESYL
ncbi:hypothetical protein HZB01_05330 [Candidatus Woesearchaeota archaeon]|nr:hypothetical protein [Candidatus Woesearchaeota archaeon]